MGSKIEWTNETWNPVTGCTKISPGCKNCYADRMAKRLQAMGVERYSEGFKVKIQNDVLNVPYKWKRSRLVFVNSMSDLFHNKVSDSFIKKVFKVMNECPQHNFQVLTKRPERVIEIADKVEWTDNIWMGVSVENQEYSWRASMLAKVPANVRFLSIEPLIGPVSRIALKNIDWVIVGGESGPRARPMEEAWVLKIKEKCVKQNVPFFFKQWGGVNKKKTGRLLENREWNEMPTAFL